MEGFFVILFFAMIIASICGGVVLARKWVVNPFARVLLSLVLIVAFIMAGTAAVISGCTAISGPVNFH